MEACCPYLFTLSGRRNGQRKKLLQKKHDAGGSTQSFDVIFKEFNQSSLLKLDS